MQWPNILYSNFHANIAATLNVLIGVNFFRLPFQMMMLTELKESWSPFEKYLSKLGSIVELAYHRSIRGTT